MIANMFMDICKRRKSTSKHPVTLITNFLPSEELDKKQLIMM